MSAIWSIPFFGVRNKIGKKVMWNSVCPICKQIFYDIQPAFGKPVVTLIFSVPVSLPTVHSVNSLKDFSHDYVLQEVLWEVQINISQNT